MHLNVSICKIEKGGDFTILTAKTKDGKIIILSKEMEREQLRKWRKTTIFYCTQCDVPVNLKVGDIVIPHFAHKKDASCSASFSEGESKEHLEGKQQLYEFFRRNSKEVKLEPYFKTLAQRPDLLVAVNSKYVPIEFQCSTIPVSQIELRTKGYMRAKMKPIWILHTPAKLKTLPQGVGILHLSRFQTHFISHTTSSGNILLTYNPQSEQFHYFSNMLHISGNKYIGIHRTLSVSKQVFPFARPKFPSANELSRYAWLYISIRKKFLNTIILLNKKGINNPFLRGCYELRMTPSELPLWIGVPLTISNPFRVHATEWQLELIYFMKKQGAQFDKLSEGTIRSFVRGLGDSSEKQVEACLKYKDYLLSIGITSTGKHAEFDENDLVKAIALTFLAK